MTKCTNVLRSNLEQIANVRVFSVRPELSKGLLAMTSIPSLNAVGESALEDRCGKTELFYTSFSGARIGSVK